MPISTDQYNRILSRLTAMENSFNDMAVAIDNFITLSQMNQLMTLLQQDIDDLRQQVVGLENRVTSIEEEPLS